MAVIPDEGMAHPRKLIRHAVVALLTDTTSAEARVQGTRVEPYRASRLPAISVYTLNDPVAEDVTTDAERTHVLDLEIAGFVAHTDAISADDAMDDLAEEIEAAMAASPHLTVDGVRRASEVRLVGTVMEVREEDARSSPLVGIVVLTYEVTYRVDLVADEPVDDFLRAGATHTPADAIDGDTVPASDRFTVQESP